MKSIKLKILCAILGVSGAIIIGIWFFQVVLLEKFYFVQKRGNMLSDTQEIVSMMDSSGSDLPSEKFLELCSKKNYCIEIFNTVTRQSLNFTPRGTANLLSDSIFPRTALLTAMAGSELGKYFEDSRRSEYGRDFYLVSSHQMTDSFDFVIILASELAPVGEAVSTIKTQLIFISAGFILVATLAAFWLAKSLTKPILKISQAARDVAAGDFNVQVQVPSNDEIGRLSQDFNLMVHEIAKSSQLQRELIANVSHDIRTPLTMIKGYAETIRDLTGDNKQKRESQLDIIIDESNRLDLLVNDILGLSRLQSGQLQLTYSDFDLAQKLRDIINRYDLLTANEGFVFTLTVPHSAIVHADEIKIDQVIYNIINNATNHTGIDKKVMISLEISDGFALVKIADTGAGINEQDIPLIWERYYKPFKKNDRKGMGTGLGLSIVKAILSAHNAEFGVHSVLGEGSVFWFKLKIISTDLAAIVTTN